MKDTIVISVKSHGVADEADTLGHIDCYETIKKPGRFGGGVGENVTQRVQYVEVNHSFVCPNGLYIW